MKRRAKPTLADQLNQGRRATQKASKNLNKVMAKKRPPRVTVDREALERLIRAGDKMQRFFDGGAIPYEWTEAKRAITDHAAEPRRERSDGIC